MSTLKVQVLTVDEVLPHPNADRMAVLKIGGHTTCTGLHNTGTESEPRWECPYAPGDRVLYVPPDAILPDEIAEKWGVKSYLGTGNRVKTVKLRGLVSRGFVVQPPTGIDGELPHVGTNLAPLYGITKYEPPAPTSNDLEPELPGFHRYTSIERIQNYPGIFEDGEQVVITEKIHGTNSRVGLVRVDGEMVTVCGTHNNQVKMGVGSKYEYPLVLRQVGYLFELLRTEFPDASSIIVFGEIYGKTVQGNMPYACDLGYSVFDIAVDGNYLRHSTISTACERVGLTVVPLLYEGEFSMDTVEGLSDGRSNLPGVSHIREGVVVKPAVERWDDEIGRVILKRIGDSYECKQYEWSDSH